MLRLKLSFLGIFKNLIIKVIKYNRICGNNIVFFDLKGWEV